MPLAGVFIAYIAIKFIANAYIAIKLLLRDNYLFLG